MMQAQRLDRVADITMGQAPEGESYNLDGEGLPLIAGAGDFGELHPEPKKFTTAPGKTCQTGDVILGIRATIGEKVLADGTYCLGRGVAGLRAKSGLDERYLWHWLTHVAPSLAAKAKGATFKQVNREDIGELPITLPRLPEQRRIAEILDKADALRAKRRAALAKLDTLTQSIFLDMFGDLSANGRDWPVTPVGHFVSGFETGKNLVADDEDDASSRFRVLKVSAVTSMQFRPEESKALPPAYAPPPSHFVRRGDLLFSRANTAELIGATALVHDAPEGLVLPDKLWRFCWHDEPRADPRFVQWLFRQPKFRFELARRATGTSGSMKNISQEKVLGIKVALPPLALQTKFGQAARGVERMRSDSEKALAEGGNLFASLQHRAFQGEV